MSSFLQTLLDDGENIVESDLPTAADVRKVLAALVKRVEQLTGITDTQAPAEPPVPAPQPQADPVGPPPTPTSPPAPEAAAAADGVTVTQGATVDATSTPSERQAQIDQLKAELAALEAQQ